MMDIMGVGSCNAFLPFASCKVSEYGVSHLSGSRIGGRLGASALVVIVDHLVASAPEMLVQSAPGVEVLAACRTLMFVFFDGRHGVRWSV